MPPPTTAPRSHRTLMTAIDATRKRNEELRRLLGKVDTKRKQQQQGRRQWSMLTDELNAKNAEEQRCLLPSCDQVKDESADSSHGSPNTRPPQRPDAHQYGLSPLSATQQNIKTQQPLAGSNPKDTIHTYDPPAACCDENGTQSCDATCEARHIPTCSVVKEQCVSGEASDIQADVALIAFDDCEQQHEMIIAAATNVTEEPVGYNDRVDTPQEKPSVNEPATVGVIQLALHGFLAREGRKVLSPVSGTMHAARTFKQAVKQEWKNVAAAVVLNKETMSDDIALMASSCEEKISSLCDRVDAAACAVLPTGGERHHHQDELLDCTAEALELFKKLYRQGWHVEAGSMQCALTSD